VEYLSLVFLHVLFGILWAGGAVATGLFIVPSVIDAGPAGGAVMAGVVKRKFPIVMTVSAWVVLLTGLRLYMIRFSTSWVTTPEGLVISLGALLAIAAFVMGVFVQKPTVEKLAALGAEVAASGAPPSPAKAAEMQTLRTKLRKIASLTAWHLLAAAALMASHRLATAL